MILFPVIEIISYDLGLYKINSLQNNFNILKYSIIYLTELKKIRVRF